MIGAVALAFLVVVCLPWTLALVRDPVGRAALLVIGPGCIAAGLFCVLGLGAAENPAALVADAPSRRRRDGGTRDFNARRGRC